MIFCVYNCVVLKGRIEKLTGKNRVGKKKMGRKKITGSKGIG